MGSIEILGGLYMKPGMKIDRYETEEVISLGMIHDRNDMKLIPK